MHPNASLKPRLSASTGVTTAEWLGPSSNRKRVISNVTYYVQGSSHRTRARPHERHRRSETSARCFARSQRCFDMTNPKQFLIHTAPTGAVRVDVLVQGESVWLTQEQLAQQFGRERSVITKHQRNIFKEAESRGWSTRFSGCGRV